MKQEAFDTEESFEPELPAPDTDAKTELSPDEEAAHTVAAREALRRQLAADVEAFLSQGGNIASVERGLRADPPSRPRNNYGRNAI